MTRTHLRLPSLPVLLLAAVVVAMLAFGTTRWIVDRADASGALPPLDMTMDTAAAAPNAMDAAKLDQQRRDTVVAIDATVGDEPLIGSGVVVDTKGTIVTASHVIQDYASGAKASNITVRMTNGDSTEARLVAIDQYNDLAILHVDPASVTRLVAAPMGTSDTVLTGAEVAAIGSPYGKDWTLTLGHVSNVHQTVGSKINRDWEIPDAIQFDAAINPGNSGGPLFDARGQVIGIVQQIAGETKANTGISFAVSSSIVARAIRLSATNAEIPYAWTGITASTLAPHLAKEQGLGVSSGAIIQKVTGPAERSGLSVGSRVVPSSDGVTRLGDVVTSIGGLPVRNEADLERASGLLLPNTSVDVVIYRDGAKQTLQLTPGPRQITRAQA